LNPKIVFWYEFASPYSYLSAMRIADAAERAMIEVEWRPFLLGVIFKAQGWDTSPFAAIPARGRYLRQDLGRISAARGLTFTMPEVFPANALKAARLAIAAKSEDRICEFSRAVFTAAFSKGRDISDNAVLDDCIAEAGLDGAQLRARAGDPSVKDELRGNTEEAQRLGIFGAPSFTTRDEALFWGDDRLEQALAWAISVKGRAA
jgi:2-hydroxychromene-2-carboxylate isomerase